ncbi:MAG: Xaa-Pro peptidase family protein [Dysgonamonadaceae bacterium]|jgi:Xaa-Pro aminopeptidase|nr:Xaa-Pro peptidase family protein [Dysgonamonadaceae bacterium]
MMDNSKFPPVEELRLRWEKLQQTMRAEKADACLISSNVNIYYLTGLIFSGYVFIPVSGEPVYFVRKPEGLENQWSIAIRKPEDIPLLLQERKFPLPKSILLETDQISYNEYLRVRQVFTDSEIGNATPLLRTQRMIKTSYEIEQLLFTAKIHAAVYTRIKQCYHQGITDIELQSNIEREMRLAGSLGLFRCFGNNMDIYMGSLLTGENAATPSPYDFALGGGGLHPCFPIGANGSMLKEGTSVMIDMVGNYTAYLTDMTRVFAVGRLPEQAYRVHQVSQEMHAWFLEKAIPGTACSDIYDRLMAMAEASGFGRFFMGLKQKAKFVGHGVGLEINELPVLTNRSKDRLQPGMAIALEPKFVLPGIGAVGNENTYLVREKGLEKITIFEEDIIEFQPQL